MPFESEAQRKAMYAAASGKSNIGIPKEVAKKFIKHSTDDTEEAPSLLALPPEKDRKYDAGDSRDSLNSIKNIIAEIASHVSELKEDQAKPEDDCELTVRQGKQDSVTESKGDPNAELTGVHPAVEMPVDKMAGAAGRAAGILFLTDENEALFIRRGDGGDFPRTWACPGGHQNAEESLEDCARRECEEETGIKYEGPLEILYDNGQFCTYIARHAKKEDVKLNYESSGFDWCSVDTPPTPLHPGMFNTIRAASAKTEYDIAELVKDEIYPSPQMFANVMLLAIRITGTGLAYRSSIGEHVWRDPSLYLNEEFLKRCNGLIVIMDHPETAVLNTEEFKDRAVGSIILPYIKGDEVWGIAKIYDKAAMAEIVEGEISTSPSVVFDNTAGNTTLTTENGEPLLIEGVPFLLDHIAIVTKARGSKGVWDKGGDPAGVLLTNPEVSDMTEKISELKADAQGDKLDAILSALSGIAARVDEMEKNLPAPPLVTAADKKRKDDDEDDAKSKKDDDEDDRKDDDKARKDSKRKDDDEEDDRKDAEGSEPEEHGKSGEMKPDDDEDDEDDKARKADEEEAKYADAQAKADSVFASFGKSASRPLAGESLMNYRKRLLRGLQAYSDAYKDVNITSIKDSKLLSLAEKQIFADALAASKSPMTYAADQEVEIHEKDRAGRTITKFRGGFGWLDAFKVPPMRAMQFNTMNNQR